MRSLKRIVKFEAKLGWAEVIALIAIAISVTTYIQNKPLKQLLDQRPKLVATAWGTRMVGGKKSGSVFAEITNTGDFPAKGVQFSFDTFSFIKNKGSLLTAKDIGFVIDPSYEYDLKLEHSVAYVTLKAPIPPKGKVFITIMGSPSGLTVVNDFGDHLYLRKSDLKVY